jgi:hypothetical protein
MLNAQGGTIDRNPRSLLIGEVTRFLILENGGKRALLVMDEQNG